MPELEEHLFRRESSRMIAALTRLFGVRNLALVEDVVQDAFCRALEAWKLRGLPDNPGAWLMATAKNRALDLIRRRATAEGFAPELERLLGSEWTRAAVVEEAFAAHTIRDEQLRMMFSCCHPSLPEEAQLALVLGVLCGFGAGEIATALLIGRAAAEKRLARGKKQLADAERLFDLGDQELGARVAMVQRALYLLFNEGYHASTTDVVREDLCAEAMRLVSLLLEHEPAATPATHALAALMCLHAARLPARVDARGEIVALVDQDRSRWDARLVAQGLALFEKSTSGTAVSAFHVEAAIAVVHAGAHDLRDTDWNRVISLYDRLMDIAPSPVVALNRAIAIAQRDGSARGLAELRRLSPDDAERLAGYPFLAAAFGELELRAGHPDAARAHFDRAMAVARTDAERRFFARRRP